MVPNIEVPEPPENRAESKVAKTTPRPDTKSQDFGKIIFPSENLASAQKITQAASPTTKSRPLETSIGMMEKGKQKGGNKTTTRNSDKKEYLSNVSARMA